jgi:hypothetical protein
MTIDQDFEVFSTRINHFGWTNLHLKPLYNERNIKSIWELTFCIALERFEIVQFLDRQNVYFIWSNVII